MTFSRARNNHFLKKRMTELSSNEICQNNDSIYMTIRLFITILRLVIWYHMNVIKF